jgi:hypothetical protein
LPQSVTLFTNYTSCITPDRRVADADFDQKMPQRLNFSVDVPETIQLMNFYAENVHQDIIKFGIKL